MGSSAERSAVAVGLSLALAGAVACVAWLNGLWLVLAGALLTILWLVLLSVLTARHRAVPHSAPVTAEDREATLQRMVIDASPTPLLLVDGTVARALNRAARRLFATDDRVRQRRYRFSTAAPRICAMPGEAGAPIGSILASRRSSR